jgi:hypothetical protein
MKSLFLLSIICLCYSIINAQEPTAADRKELHDLLEARKIKFDSYSESLQKHSGIFGIRTKNDMKKSNEVLVDIVQTDNRIISALYRVVDFKTFEKVNMNYDNRQKDEVVNNLTHATDTLSKQLDVVKASYRAERQRANILQYGIYLLLAIIGWMLIQRWRKNRGAEAER